MFAVSEITLIGGILAVEMFALAVIGEMSRRALIRVASLLAKETREAAVIAAAAVIVAADKKTEEDAEIARKVVAVKAELEQHAKNGS